MGGLGSGRYEYATSPTVEDCHTISMTAFSNAVAYPGSSTTIQWGPKDNPSASIGIQLLPRSGDADKATALRFYYTIIDDYTQEKSVHDYCIPLEYTGCNFGGDRPWFRCPGVVDGNHCNRRVSKLYRPPHRDLYLCRHCYDLGYRSSRTSGDELKQSELRYRRAYSKLDEQDRRPHPSNSQVPSVPDRPMGMHHDTYEGLVDELTQARLEWENALIENLYRITPDLECI